MRKMDKGGALDMPTYSQIAADVRARHGRSVKTCWIAHVKELNCLSMRSAPNRINARVRMNPCPDWARPLIEESMRRLGML